MHLIWTPSNVQKMHRVLMTFTFINSTISFYTVRKADKQTVVVSGTRPFLGTNGSLHFSTE